MLSYRHSFHAGNYADVLKHLIQVAVLNYLRRKDKPFIYMDTHAAAGMYSLVSDEAGKNSEYQGGIEALEALLSRTDSTLLVDYWNTVRACREEHGDNTYPGSPWLAQHLMRDQDRALMFELHPQDLGSLEQLTYRDRRILVRGEDSFTGLIAALPPKIRRGLVLIDPPYEVKTDYDRVVNLISAAHRRFATATYALWYPVVDRARIQRLEQRLVRAGIANIQLFELGICPDTDVHGMTASGMILVNPPYTLKPDLDSLLPGLTSRLAEANGFSGQGHWRSEILVGEQG